MEILVVPTEQYKSSKLPIKTLINNKGFYVERSKAEDNPDWLQIIPYILVRQDGCLFAYQRLNKGTEARLHGKFSVGIGGHTDYLTDSVSNWETVIYNANKELHEELDIELNKVYLDVTFEDKTIYDPSNDVGKVHLGLIFTVDVTGRKVDVREKDKISGKFYHLQNLKDIFNTQDNMETWSVIALKEMLKW